MRFGQHPSTTDFGASIVESLTESLVRRREGLRGFCLENLSSKRKRAVARLGTQNLETNGFDDVPCTERRSLILSAGRSSRKRIRIIHPNHRYPSAPQINALTRGPHHNDLGLAYCTAKPQTWRHLHSLGPFRQISICELDHKVSTAPSVMSRSPQHVRYRTSI
jgi:hypothetical protein